jgi:hypothetical protein
MSPQEISKTYKCQSLGIPPRHPFFISKNRVTFQHTIFLLLHILCIFLGASLLLLSVLFCFVCCNIWLDQTNFFWRRHTPFFICQEHSIFTLIVQRVFTFSRTRLAFIFRLDFCSDLVISLHQGVFIPLVYVGFHQKSCFKKV